MASITERPTGQKPEERIEEFLHAPISRRKFLRLGGAVLSAAMIAQACGTPNPVTTPKTEVHPSAEILTPSPESTKPLPQTLSGETFSKAFSSYSDTTEINIGSKKITIKDLASYGSQAWNDNNLNSFSISMDTVEGLKLAISASEMQGATGTVDYSKIFNGLALELPRFSIKTLLNEQNAETYAGVFPQNLTLREGMDMTVVGIDSKESAIVAFSDTLRKPDKSPTIYFASLPVDAPSGQMSFGEFLARNGASYDTQNHSILYTDSGKTLPIYIIEDKLSQSLENTVGSYFIDLDPLRKNKDRSQALTEYPVVAPLPSNLSGDKLTQLKDGRVVVVDANNNPLARARFSFSEGYYDWATDPESLKDFTIREIADAGGISISTFADINYLQNPQFSNTLETVSNKLTIAAELDQSMVFGNFQVEDWKNILVNWSTIQEQLDKGILPQGFNYKWNLADRMVNFAESNGMQIKAQHLLSGGDDSPDSVINGGFNNADLTKILEFMVKTRVLNYKGVINEWEGASETFTINAYGSDLQKFWYTRLGEGVIGKVFQWAHEANPKAQLNITEDHVLDPDNPQVTQGFLNLLRRLKQDNIPVDTAVIENNIWAYTPPNKDTMIQILKEIKNMGYKIGPSETTVSVSDHDPLYQDRQKLVTITNKDQAQAKIYRDLLEAYLTVGNQFGLGGFSDAVSWLTAIGHPEAEAMIFDKDYQPKSAYWALLEVLKKHA